MTGGTTIAIGTLVAIAAGATSILAKGPDQLLWRHSIVLAVFFMWALWICTYLAQLYPLIAPQRGDLREIYWEHES